VFSSVVAMTQWNPAARPVPANAQRVALAAASESTDVVVLDATSPTEFVIRRPALEAIARSHQWVPSFLDPEVLDAFLTSASGEAAVVAIQLAPGDPDARLTALLERLQRRWTESELIASRVDSLGVALAAAAS